MQVHTVREIMSSRVLAVSPNLSIRELSRLLLEAHVSGAPVVDELGQPIGVVSKSDILDRIHNQEATYGMDKVFYRSAFGLAEPLGPGFHIDAETEGTVEEIMTPLVIKVELETPIEVAARLMAFENVHRVLVVDKGRMVGILTSMDIVRAVAGAKARTTNPEPSRSATG
jgi:predicted transcriptional regulator